MTTSKGAPISKTSRQNLKDHVKKNLTLIFKFQLDRVPVVQAIKENVEIRLIVVLMMIMII